MEYISVAEAAKRWGLSERSVRHSCAQGRIPGARLVGKTWKLPEDAERPARKARSAEALRDVRTVLREEKAAGRRGGLYHRVQIDLTYNSNHIEGSRLSHDQTRLIFETNTVGLEGPVRVDDVVETANHFRCVDLIIDAADAPPAERLIRQLHAVLKNGTSDSRKPWFAVGAYKRIPNEVGGRDTTAPEAVPAAMKALLRDYNAKKEKSFDDLLDFHYRFERIHPFQDGNGRIGRLLLFQECLRCGIVPFILTDALKPFYYRGLQNWETERGYLRDTCLLAQDQFRLVLDYFKVQY